MVHFKKSETEPASLAIEKAKTNGSYREADVLTAIKSDFKNKCYICEWKMPITINVEHFLPHKGDKDLKFAWENLFWSCSHCNNTKSDNFTNILNCTLESDGVATKIKYNINLFPFGEVYLHALENDPKVRETVSLLDAVYNGTTPLKKIESENLRTAISDEMILFRTSLVNYLKTDIPDIKAEYLRNIRDHLSKNSNFTAFKRWAIVENSELKNVFEQFFD